jgi:hypothetical protein
MELTSRMPFIDTGRLDIVQRLPRALTDGRAIIVDHPLRSDLG